MQTLIKKVGPTKVEIDSTVLDVKDYKGIVPGTDVVIFKNKDKFNLAVNMGIDIDTDYEILGGFHFGLIPESFTAINNISAKKAKKIKGINAFSIWTREHRPVSNPCSMAYIKKLDIWADIYKVSNLYENRGHSKAGEHILAGEDYNGRKLPKGKDDFNYKDGEELAKKYDKRMPTEEEFKIIAHGVKEYASTGDLDDGTIKHIPDFTSKYGVEQATGVQWVWSSEMFDNRENTRKIFGGNRGGSDGSGSSCSDWAYHLWVSYWNIGFWFLAEPLNPVKKSRK
ncbi:hypothetical protein [Aliarcobacter butzleri]|uniref:hypothetical protein n=1 Tax=Aliarcobacter butzleri TaxID=28197 RepID=UPI0015878C3B|nr:hypothetical protein [Aliarcobacter butzleri]NUW28953.1 hypothetical protein [Aliarcobacter butzleri]